MNMIVGVGELVISVAATAFILTVVGLYAYDRIMYRRR